MPPIRYMTSSPTFPLSCELWSFLCNVCESCANIVSTLCSIMFPTVVAPGNYCRYYYSNIVSTDLMSDCHFNFHLLVSKCHSVMWNTSVKTSLKFRTVQCTASENRNYNLFEWDTQILKVLFWLLWWWPKYNLKLKTEVICTCLVIYKLRAFIVYLMINYNHIDIRT